MPHEDAEQGIPQEQIENAAFTNTNQKQYADQVNVGTADRYAYMAEKLQAKSSVGCTAARFSPLQAWLQADLDKISPLYRNTLRAQDILRRHPDFEELIELLTLLGVNIPGLSIARG